MSYISHAGFDSVLAAVGLGEKIPREATGKPQERQTSVELSTPVRLPHAVQHRLD